MSRNKRIYRMPIAGFLAVILLIALLLKLPICNKSYISYIDSLFEATTVITGTGSNVVNISQQFTFIGQIIILLAMQIGAIGFMLFFSLLFVVNKKKLKLSDTIFLSNEINTSNYTLIKEKAKKIISYTFVIEILGALLLAFKLVPMYGLREGIWYSFFHAVSAFCNVGIDLFGNDSLVFLKNDIYSNIILIILMLLGSIGFFVLEDLVYWFCTGKQNKFNIQSKLVLNVSFVIIIIGTILIKTFNPQLTILETLFTVVSARNTGLYTIDISSLSEINQFLISFMMFIGGGPGSNAGGIRVMVFSILILTTIANIKNRDEVVVFYRAINDKIIKKAITILTIDLLIVFIGMMAFSVTENKNLLDIIFYVISLFSNTGFATIDVSQISFVGKCISIAIMYIGRIAPITFVSLFIPTENKRSGIKYPNMDVIL